MGNVKHNSGDRIMKSRAEYVADIWKMRNRYKNLVPKFQGNKTVERRRRKGIIILNWMSNKI
jgi:hypothetical protein